MTGDCHVRICERLRGKFPGSTRFIIGFENEEEAQRVFKVLPKRMGKFGLTIHPEKSKLIEFAPKGKGKVATFDFLGFTHYWAKSQNGYPVVKRKTSSKKMQGSAQELHMAGFL